MLNLLQKLAGIRKLSAKHLFGMGNSPQIQTLFSVGDLPRTEIWI